MLNHRGSCCSDMLLYSHDSFAGIWVRVWCASYGQANSLRSVTTLLLSESCQCHSYCAWPGGHIFHPHTPLPFLHLPATNWWDTTASQCTTKPLHIDLMMQLEIVLRSIKQSCFIRWQVHLTRHSLFSGPEAATVIKSFSLIKSSFLG